MTKMSYAHRKIDTQSIPWTSPTPKKKLKCNMCKNTLRQERKVALSLLKNWKWDWWLEDDSVKHPPKFNEVCPWKLMVGRQAFPFGDGQFSGGELLNFRRVFHFLLGFKRKDATDVFWDPFWVLNTCCLSYIGCTWFAMERALGFLKFIPPTTSP